MRMVEAVKMKLLIPSGSYTLLHDKRNDEIHQELNVTNIIDMTDGKTFFFWFNRISLKIQQYKPTGIRNTRCPKK